MKVIEMGPTYYFDYIITKDDPNFKKADKVFNL